MNGQTVPSASHLASSDPHHFLSSVCHRPLLSFFLALLSSFLHSSFLSSLASPSLHISSFFLFLYTPSLLPSHLPLLSSSLPLSRGTEAARPVLQTLPERKSCTALRYAGRIWMWQRELCRECEALRCQGAETQEPATLFKEMLAGGSGGWAGCYLLLRISLCISLSSKHHFFLNRHSVQPTSRIF